jgi:hypothetical protein
MPDIRAWVRTGDTPSPSATGCGCQPAVIANFIIVCLLTFPQRAGRRPGKPRRWPVTKGDLDPDDIAHASVFFSSSSRPSWENRAAGDYSQPTIGRRATSHSRFAGRAWHVDFFRKYRGSLQLTATTLRSNQSPTSAGASFMPRRIGLCRRESRACPRHAPSGDRCSRPCGRSADRRGESHPAPSLSEVP